MIHRGYVTVPWGRLHYASSGDGEPVVLIHQTPRSWDEFRDVIPLLATRYRVVAPDTAGFGASDLPGGIEETIEIYADGLAALLDELELPSVALVGHHTGALVALELAARAPARVSALILSAAPHKTPEERASALLGQGLDEVEERADGSHLAELWQRRQAFYPQHRPDLLRRFVADALRVGDRVEEGHRAVNRYVLEDRVGLVSAPVFLMAGSDDPYAFPMLARWRRTFPAAPVVEVHGGMVPLPDQLPEAFASAVTGFIDSLGP